MKEFFTKNLEKIMLTSLLVILAVASVFLILTMDKTVTKLIKDDQAGAMVLIEKIKPFTVTPVSLNDDRPQPFDPRGYIYCRKSDCNYLILSALPKCPWCKTDTTPELKIDPGSNDQDLDGIPDQDEIRLGLNPEDNKDAFHDADSDGFLNIDEYRLDTDVNDATSHPSIINRCKLHPRVQSRSYYPIIFSYLTVGDEKDKSTWDIYADIFVNRRKVSIFKRVNDKIPELGYVITDVGKENGKEFIILEKEGEDPLTLFASKKRVPKSTEYIIANELTGTTIKVGIGKEFQLKNKAGTSERYKAESFSPQSRELTVIDYQTSQKVKLGLQPKLKSSSDSSDPTTGSSLEDDLKKLREL